MLLALGPAGPLRAAENPAGEPAKDTRKLLQEGLFEEEASRDLDKAAAAYSAVVAQFDAQRALAATAIFRLAEVRHKQGRKDEAAALWQRVVAEFPQHDPLAKLSRERLAGIGIRAPEPGADLTSDEERREVVRLRSIAKDSPDLLSARGESGTPLDVAAANGWLQAADFLLSNGVSVDDQATGRGALVIAAGEGHKSMVQFLLDRGAKIDAIGNYTKGNIYENCTPLIAAIVMRRDEVFNQLVARGANVNTPDWKGRSPLLRACDMGRVETARTLLAKGADPNAPQTGKSDSPRTVGEKAVVFTPLWWAAVTASNGNPELLKLLLDHGAKPLVPGGEFATELESAIDWGAKEAVSLLLAKLPKLTDSGPLYQATTKYDLELLKIVLRHHADVNVKLKTGVKWSPLTQVIGPGWLEAIAPLLEAGASARTADENGRTPLHALAGCQLNPFTPPQPLGQSDTNSPLDRRRVREVRQNPSNTPLTAPRPSPLPPQNVQTHQYYSAFFFQQAEMDDAFRESGKAMNEEWEKRRPYFEALLAKGADINAADVIGSTPLHSLMASSSQCTDAVAWFVAKGGDLSAKYREWGTDKLITPLDLGYASLRPDYARRYLFPKLAKPDAVLVWGQGSFDQPAEIKRSSPEQVVPHWPDLEKLAPLAEKGIGPKTLFAVINRKGLDGNWVEAAIVRVPLKAGEEWPKPEWGDAIFFCPTSNRATPDASPNNLDRLRIRELRN